MNISLQPRTNSDELVYGDSISPSTAFRFRTGETSYGSFTAADGKDYFSFAPGWGTFTALVTVDPANGFQHTATGADFRLALITASGSITQSSSLNKTIDGFTKALTITTNDNAGGPYFLEITNQNAGSYRYALTLREDSPRDSNQTITGTSASENLIGAHGDDNISGGNGNDTINSSTGEDTVSGGAGDDVIAASGGYSTYLRGDEGNDRISGGTGFDDAHGNMGNDTVSGGAGDDWVVGGKDNDLLFGDQGWDIVYGNLGEDTCSGGDGSDWVRGGQGNDSVQGGAGDDLIWGDRGSDTVSGGSGADVFGFFAGAGIDRITDFNLAEGDKVRWEASSVSYVLTSNGVDTVVNFGNGDVLTLTGFSGSPFDNSWLITLG